MRNIHRLLNQRHPAYDDPRGYLRTITIISVFVFLILWIFKPFNFQNFPPDRIFLYAFLYVGGAYLTMLVCLIWIVRFPKIFAADTWTLGKEMLFVAYQFTTIAFTVWLITGVLVDRPGANKSYPYIWTIIASGGLLPYLVATSLKHTYLLRRNLREALHLQEQLTALSSLAVSRQPLVVPGMLVPLTVDEFLFAKSDGNDLNLTAEKGGSLQQYTIRITLKQWLLENQQSGKLFQCHRTYVINYTRIQALTANAGSCVVKLHEDVPEIPVSRPNVTRLRELLR